VRTGAVLEDCGCLSYLTFGSLNLETWTEHLGIFLGAKATPLAGMYQAGSDPWPSERFGTVEKQPLPNPLSY
jgi:hypothetical protein